MPTYKDLDFMEIHPEGILLEADTYTALTNTIKRDCRVRFVVFFSLQLASFPWPTIIGGCEMI